MVLAKRLLLRASVASHDPHEAKLRECVGALDRGLPASGDLRATCGEEYDVHPLPCGAHNPKPTLSDQPGEDVRLLGLT
jgi:hypothetical protein